MLQRMRGANEVASESPGCWSALPGSRVGSPAGMDELWNQGSGQGAVYAELRGWTSGGVHPMLWSTGAPSADGSALLIKPPDLVQQRAADGRPACASLAAMAAPAPSASHANLTFQEHPARDVAAHPQWNSVRRPCILAIVGQKSSSHLNSSTQRQYLAL